MAATLPLLRSPPPSLTAASATRRPWRRAAGIAGQVDKRPCSGGRAGSGFVCGGRRAGGRAGERAAGRAGGRARGGFVGGARRLRYDWAASAQNSPSGSPAILPTKLRRWRRRPVAADGGGQTGGSSRPLVCLTARLVAIACMPLLYHCMARAHLIMLFNNTKISRSTRCAGQNEVTRSELVLPHHGAKMPCKLQRREWDQFPLSGKATVATQDK